jgi:diguanylate cyclase (GGDEF)-like protein
MRLTANDGSRELQPMPSMGAGASSAALLAGLALVFALDRSTGWAPVQHLYYLPIMFAAVRFGFTGGCAASFAAILLYHVANPRLLALEHGHWDVVQVALFAAVGLITARLTHDQVRLRTLASTDDLTGLHNLRSFERRLASMVRACRDARVPLAVLVLDVDRLKSLNDAHGHLAGAEAVRMVGRIIAAHVPPDAVACRYGGDEFVIALPRCTAADGRAFADRLRHAVSAAAPVLAGLAFPAKTLSVSVGVACHAFASRTEGGRETEQGEALFLAADRALYQAKQLGRNHVHVA